MEETISAKAESYSQKEFLLQNIPPYIRHYITGHIRKQKELLLEEQQEVLQDFYLYLVTEKGKITKYNSYLGYISTISKFARFIKKPFNEVTKEDIKQFFFYLHAKGQMESSINEYKIKIKVFFRFLYGTKEYPPIVEWIELAPEKQKEISEDLLLTREDIKLMADCADNIRDKAIVTILYESASRRSELLSCRIKHVIPDKYGFKLKLPESKTKERTVRLIDSVPYMQEWLNNHPLKNNSDSPLFIDFGKKHYGKPLGVEGLFYIIHRLAKLAGIQKRVYCHLFRHSRLTELGKKGFNERDLRIIAGWSDDSKMPKTYLHYDEKHVDDKLLQKEGKISIEKQEEEKKIEEALKPIDCPRCKLVNSATSKYCNSCGMALDLKTVMQDTEKIERVNDFMEDLSKDKDYGNKFLDLVNNFMKSRKEARK